MWLARSRRCLCSTDTTLPLRDVLSLRCSPRAPRFAPGYPCRRTSHNLQNDPLPGATVAAMFVMLCSSPLNFGARVLLAQAAATAAAFGGAVLAGQTQIVSAETLYDKVSALAAAVEALEKKAGGVSSEDLKCAR
jgi:hypothetical protein